MHVNGSGAAVGLSEALCGIPRLGTVTADTHVEAFTLGTKVFKAIMENSPEACTPHPTSSAALPPALIPDIVHASASTQRRRGLPTRWSSWSHDPPLLWYPATYLLFPSQLWGWPCTLGGGSDWLPACGTALQRAASKSDCVRTVCPWVFRRCQTHKGEISAKATVHALVCAHERLHTLHACTHCALLQCIAVRSCGTASLPP